MPYSRWTLLMVAAFGLTTGGWGQSTTSFTLANSPHPLVSVKTFADNSFPSTAPQASHLFTPDLVLIKKAALVVDNQSDKPIVALAGTWVIKNAQGKEITLKFTCDSFLRTIGAKPVLGPHSRMLVAPSLWIPEAQIATIEANPRFQQKRTGLLRIENKFAASAQVSISMDVVIFADGEVAGANKLQFDQELKNRKIAAGVVAKVIDEAASHAVDPTASLASMASATVSASDSLAVWERTFAQMLLHSHNQQQSATYFRNMPDVPKFYASTLIGGKIL